MRPKLERHLAKLVTGEFDRQFPSDWTGSTHGIIGEHVQFDRRIHRLNELHMAKFNDHFNVDEYDKALKTLHLHRPTKIIVSFSIFADKSASVSVIADILSAG